LTPSARPTLQKRNTVLRHNRPPRKQQAAPGANNKQVRIDKSFMNPYAWGMKTSTAAQVLNASPSNEHGLYLCLFITNAGGL
jgi:hypothetical protein